jgi:hypothetical protein
VFRWHANLKITNHNHHHHHPTIPLKSTTIAPWSFDQGKCEQFKGKTQASQTSHQKPNAIQKRLIFREGTTKGLGEITTIVSPKLINNNH